MGDMLDNLFLRGYLDLDKGDTDAVVQVKTGSCHLDLYDIGVITSLQPVEVEVTQP
jgi:hypothetical protein